MKTWKQDGYRVYSNGAVVGTLTEEQYREIARKVQLDLRVYLSATNRILTEFELGLRVAPSAVFYLITLADSASLAEGFSASPEVLQTLLFVALTVATVFCVVRCVLTDTVTRAFENAKNHEVRMLLGLWYLADIYIEPKFTCVDSGDAFVAQ